MLDKFPAFREDHTILIQPFGGQIYLSKDLATKIGTEKHRHDLNVEGAAVLKKCTGLKTVEDIIKEICQEFDDVHDSVAPKVVNFLKDAIEKGYVSLQDTACPAKGYFKGSTNYITPFMAMVEVTSACNLRCIHCYGCYGIQTQNELNTNEFLEILGKLHEMGVEGMNITGGEPLMRKDIIEILDYCYDRSAFSLLTNCTLVDDEFSRKFSDYVTSPIQTSLYGYRAEDHDAVTTVPGSFDATLKGIKSLIRHGNNVMVAYLWKPGNLNYIREMAKFCAELGIYLFRVGSLVSTGRGKNVDWTLSKSDFYQVSQLIEELRKDYDGRMDIQSWDPGGQISMEFESDTEELRHLKCNVGAYSIVVASNGDLLPCGMLRWTLGNLKRENLSQLFAKADTQFFSTIYAPSRLLCKDCEFLYKCRKCHAQAAINFSKVKDCPWHAQFSNAPEIILKNL